MLPLQKPTLWNADPGILEYNCRKHGMPVPVGAWPMWGGAGRILYDYSRNGNHGIFPILSDTPIWSKEGVYWDKKRGIAIGNTASAPDSLAFSGTDELTIFQYIDNESEAVDSDWCFAQGTEKVLRMSGSKMQFVLNSFSTNDRVTSTVTRKGKYAVIGMFDGTKLWVYVDGVGDSVTPTGTYNNPADEMCIGGNSYFIDTYSWWGHIYVTLIFDVSLTLQQINFISKNPYFMFRVPDELYGYAAAAGVSIPVFIHQMQQQGIL